jgi:adenine C2-methylase RlmN of 23S rRNA A2503 and tRNA A37
VEAVVRRSRGLDINAACGQLRVEVEKKRRGVEKSVNSKQ